MVEQPQSLATQSSNSALEPRSYDSRSQIRENALRMGFDAVGFSRASLGLEVRERLSHFIQSGLSRRHGLARRLDRTKEVTPNVYGPRREV